MFPDPPYGELIMLSSMLSPLPVYISYALLSSNSNYFFVDPSSQKKFSSLKIEDTTMKNDNETYNLKRGKK